MLIEVSGRSLHIDALSLHRRDSDMIVSGRCADNMTVIIIPVSLYFGFVGRPLSVLSSCPFVLIGHVIVMPDAN